MTGESKVKKSCNVPDTSDTLAITLVLDPALTLEAQKSDVRLIHDTVEHLVAPKLLLGETSWTPKLNPCTVTDVAPEGAPLPGSANETTGPSKVRMLRPVPTVNPRERDIERWEADPADARHATVVDELQLVVEQLVSAMLPVGVRSVDVKLRPLIVTV
jgi:hypothetical protein